MSYRVNENIFLGQRPKVNTSRKENQIIFTSFVDLCLRKIY